MRQEIVAILDALEADQTVILGTTSAHLNDGQRALAQTLLARHERVMTVALRTPYDLVAYPEAATHLCTYSINSPAMKALAAVLAGQAEARGRLPVQLTNVASSPA